MTITSVSFALAVEKWMVQMRTQDGNKKNKEVIQHRTLFSTTSTCFSEVSFSMKMHDEAITDSKSPSVIKPITKFWNVICFRGVPSVPSFQCCTLLSYLWLHPFHKYFHRLNTYVFIGHGFDSNLQPNHTHEIFKTFISCGALIVYCLYSRVGQPLQW